MFFMLACNLQASELPLVSKAWLEPSEKVAPTQQIKLYIELSSPLRFAKSASIKLPDVAGLIVLQQEQFATNYGEMRGSDWWNIQRWELVLYPQKKGEFVIPEIVVKAYLVVEEPNKIQEKILKTTSLSFIARYPDDEDVDALSKVERKNFIAATELEVEDSFDRSIYDLELGDAIEREIIITATNSHTVLLPELKQQAYQGLSWYPKLPEKSNTVYRGDYRAEVSYRHDFVAEETGSYIFPELVIAWWNTNEDRLELITLEQQTVVVGGDATVKPVIVLLSEEQLAEKKREQLFFYAGALLVLLLMVLLLLAFIRYYQRTAEKRALFALLKQAEKQQDEAKALSLIYQFLDRQKASDYHWQLQALLEQRQLESKANSRSLLEKLYAELGGKKAYDRKTLIKLLQQKVKTQKAKAPLYQLNR
jgi:hypothetical protein